jgi:diguanylate cyclase (GGDEF)-like protein
VADSPIAAAKGKGLSRITVSIGVAGWPADGENITAVVSRADARLYEAKRAGRNRVVGPQAPGSDEAATF